MTRRFNLTLLALLFSVLLPWWFNIFILFALILFFPWYYEAGVLTFVFELIYGSGYFWLTVLIILLIPLMEQFKKRLYVFS